MVYKMHGIPLKRDAYQQAQQGNTLSFIDESEPGDLAFFDNKEGEIIHVGVLPKIILFFMRTVKFVSIESIKRAYSMQKIRPIRINYG